MGQTEAHGKHQGQMEGKPRPLGSRTKVLAGGEQGAWSGLV